MMDISRQWFRYEFPAGCMLAYVQVHRVWITDDICPLPSLVTPPYHIFV